MGVFGEPKAGKTWFAGTAPRPVFLSAAPERGWLGLRSHPAWDQITVLPVPRIPGTPLLLGGAVAGKEIPLAPETDKVPDPLLEIDWALKVIRSRYREFDWRTVVVDTTTILARMIVSYLSSYGTKAMWSKTSNQWSRVQELIYKIRDETQNLPLNVIWLFHAADEYKDDDAGENKLVGKRPELVGNAIRHLKATCRMFAYIHRFEEVVEKVAEDGTKTYVNEVTRSLCVQPQYVDGVLMHAETSFEAELSDAPWYAPKWDVFTKRLAGMID